MKKYYRLMLGRKGIHTAECVAGGFGGVDFSLQQDLTDQLPDEWRAFNARFVPVLQAANPELSRIGAGLACGAIWTVCKGMQPGDCVLSPDGSGQYAVGIIEGGYHYAPGEILPHRRGVRWLPVRVARADMSEALRNSTGSIGTVSEISKYASELEALIGGTAPPALIATDPDVEDPATFALESHLQEFLVQNWPQTDLGRQYDIYQENGELVGNHLRTDTGELDILAISKDRKTLLVVELKMGRASDQVVGQTLRYMGFVQDELAEDDQTVRGAIIALEDDQRIRRALRMAQGIDFYRYEISFKLVKG